MTGRVIPAACVLAALAALPSSALAAKPALRAFDSCPALVQYASKHARAATPTATIEPGPTPTAAPAPASDNAGAGSEKTTAAPVDVSSTNVQEAGVDEPDVVKTQGTTLFAISGTTLYAVDASGAPRIAGSLALPTGGSYELLVRDGRALVIGQRWPDVPVPLPRPVEGVASDDRVASTIAPMGPPQTVIAEIDVRDPAAMTLGQTLTFDGTPVGARLTGATARVVVTSQPRYVIDPATRSTVAGWVPTAALATPGQATPKQRRLVDCKRVRRPAAFAGTGLMTVLTIDVDQGLPAVDTDAVMADAQTVYASPRALFVATQRWEPMPDMGEPVATTPTTALHRFDTATANETTYAGSGSVAGTLLSQWALSEEDGVLRVATTRERDSAVTTLAVRDGKLVKLGEVVGLGPDERIRGVRFMGKVGYVVTFRQTDPLYTVDLADPAAPKVVGELKIPGYSAYLHPVGDGLLLGIGQDATDQGRQLGVQASLFDVSDPAQPKRLAQRTLAPQSWTAVEGDHRAFLWWPKTRTALLPLSASGFSGTIGLRVGTGSIDEAARAAGHDGVTPSRAVVVGDRVLLVAPESGVQVAALDTLAEQAWLPFPTASVRPPCCKPMPVEPVVSPAG